MLEGRIEAVTNRMDWIQQVRVTNQDGALVDLSTATIVLAVQDISTKVTKLLAQSSDGSILVVGLGVFQFTFPLAQMRGLDPNKTYVSACTAKINGVTQELWTNGSVPVLDGIVP